MTKDVILKKCDQNGDGRLSKQEFSSKTRMADGSKMAFCKVLGQIDDEQVAAHGRLTQPVFVFGYLLSSVGSLIANLDNRSNMVDKKLDQMQEVILHTSLPATLATRIRSYTEFYYSRQSVYDVDEVLKHLTPALDREVKDFFLSQSIDVIPLLRVHSKAFKVQLMPTFRPMMTELAEVIIPKATKSSDLFFLRKGEVHAVSSNGDVLCDLSEAGRCFGEHVLLGRPCPFSYISLTRCELYTM